MRNRMMADMIRTATETMPEIEAHDDFDPMQRCDYCDRRGVRAYPSNGKEPYLICDACAERDGVIQ